MTELSGIVAGAARVIVLEPERDRGQFEARSHGMDGIRELLSAARDAGLATGNFRGLLHIAIGRRVTKPDGTGVSTGLTWRELAVELKAVRFDQSLVKEFGADPEALVARDRERFWYSAISLAKVDSIEAVVEAERLIPKLASLGFVVGPAPAGMVQPAASAKRVESKPEVKPKAKSVVKPPAKKKK